MKAKPPTSAPKARSSDSSSVATLTPSEKIKNTSHSYTAINWKKESSGSVNQFFVKLLSPAECKPPEFADKSLLVTNIPSYVSKTSLKRAFEIFGEISNIFVEQNPKHQIADTEDYNFHVHQRIRGYHVAYIVYKDSKSIADIKELKFSEMKPFVLKADNSGIHAMIKSYSSRLKVEKSLDESIKEFMRNFEQKKAAEGNLSEAAEDGWVTVTRKGKRSLSGAVRTEKMEKSLRGKRAKWEKRLVNFTPTQIKESRAKNLEELKKKFDEDKQRISLLRQQRKFRPF